MHKETQETKITPAAALTWPGQSEPLSYPGLLLMPAASACLTPPQAGPRPRRWACGGGGLGSGAQGAGQRLPRGLARRRRRAHKLPCPALPCCAGGSLRFCHLGRRPLLPHQHRHSERERPGRPRLPCQWVFAHWGWVGGRAGQRRCGAHMGARPRQRGPCTCGPAYKEGDACVRMETQRRHKMRRAPPSARQLRRPAPPCCAGGAAPAAAHVRGAVACRGKRLWLPPQPGLLPRHRERASERACLRCSVALAIVAGAADSAGQHQHQH